MTLISKKTLIVLYLCLIFTLKGQTNNPKREFRGVWMQCISNVNYTTATTAQSKATLIQQLNGFQQAGINAVIFQIRPEADALYQSKHEPWSRFLSGKQGVPPTPFWDPMEFMIEECHKRNMEFHAWINPYRVKLSANSILSDDHLYYQHPELFINYGTQLFFDPGMPESRAHILKVITDITTRYDIDAIHMDDYFYPYPIEGKPFPDDRSFARYGQNFKGRRDDWRRNNVNVLVKEIHQTIRGCKPWVKFGVSPFGIYRNKKSDPDGSNTNGLQNYDQLYADVLLWINNGWVDYNIPQIYWEIGNKSADYQTLVRWWAAHAGDRPLYIGQDILRTVNAEDLTNPNRNQQGKKMQLMRVDNRIGGNCFWYGVSLLDNPSNYTLALNKVYHRFPALPPTSPFMDDKAPSGVRKLKTRWCEDGFILRWEAPKAKNEMDKAAYYCVYRFDPKEKIELDDVTKIVKITRKLCYQLPYDQGKVKYRYVVTAVDRLHNESKKETKKIKL